MIHFTCVPEEGGCDEPAQQAVNEDHQAHCLTADLHREDLPFGGITTTNKKGTRAKQRQENTRDIFTVRVANRNVAGVCEIFTLFLYLERKER